MVPKNILDSCREYLRSYHIFVKENWLTEAIEYFINLFGEDEIQMIHTAVKKQWYGHDISKICPGCLPQNLKAYRKEILKGHYVLQINSITSFEIFSQHKEFLRLHLNIKKKMERAATKLDMQDLVDKMLQLYMTDGVQEVIGIVFAPIKDLYVNTVPGIKVLLKGPVLSCGGFLLLSNKNCQLLEGDVEELMSENYDHAMNLMKLVNPNSMPSEISPNENVSCSEIEETHSIGQPTFVNEVFNNNDLDNSVADLQLLLSPPSNDTSDMITISNETNTSTITEPSIDEICEKLLLVKNEIKSWSVKRNYESSVGDVLPGSSTNNHTHYFDEFGAIRKKKKNDTQQNNENGNGIVMSLIPQNEASGPRLTHHSSDEDDIQDIVPNSLISPI